MSTVQGSEHPSPGLEARPTFADRLRGRPAAGGFMLNTGLPIVALIAMIIYFAARSDSFLTLNNFTVMSGQIGPILLVSLGATFVILMGSIDLSVASMSLLCGTVAAKMLADEAAVAPVILVAVLVAVGCGLAIGVIYAYGRVPSFVATLGALSILEGTALSLSNGSPIPFANTAISDLATGQIVPHVQNAALWAIILWAVMAFVAFRTRFGHYMYAIGGGERVARLSGIKVNRFKVYAFMLSAATAGLAGVLSVAQLGAGGPSLGSNLLLDSLAAIVVGGTPLSGGIGGVHRTLLGVLIITILANGLNQVGVDQFTQELIKGAVIIIAVAITMIPRRGLLVK